MSISMHIDEYMARRGITPDDTVVVDDPCAVFDGAVEKADGLEGGAGDGGAARAKLDEAAETVRDLLG